MIFNIIDWTDGMNVKGICLPIITVITTKPALKIYFNIKLIRIEQTL